MLDVELLNHIPIIWGVKFADSRMERGSIARIAETWDVPSLAFEKTPISDQECSHLATMRFLHYLSIDRTSVSQNAIVMLRNARPDIELEIFDSQRQ
jgi:hypothetical protein